MKENFREVIHDKLIRITSGASVVLLVGLILTFFLFQQKLPPVVPFFNSLPWGVERLAPVSAVMLVPPVLIAIFLLNNLLTVALYKRHTLVARILSFNALLFIFLGLMAYIQIVLWIF